MAAADDTHPTPPAEDSGPAASAEPPVDGRTARRQRNRDAVLDAVLELFVEGNLSPDPVEVARRSGVSLRSVYRYVADRDDLIRSAIARRAEVMAPYLAPPVDVDQPLDDRVRSFVAHRLELYELMAPAARATLLAVPREPLLAEQLAVVRRQLLEDVERHFAPELARLPVAEARAAAAGIDVLFQFEGMEHLAVRRGLGERQQRDVLGRAVHALLAPAPGH